MTMTLNIIITGAAGFLGSRLADALLEDRSLSVNRLLLVDTILPAKRNDPRVAYLAINLTAKGAPEKIIEQGYNLIFHLAAIVSGHAEADFNLGLIVNFDATRALLERIRHVDPQIKFVFTSTTGVFGGNLPTVLDDLTATTPQNSYGTAKAMCDLLINDYARRGFVDARIVRLPTVSVRSGTANKAVTSFASGIIREPLNGVVSVCPVRADQKIWLTSPEAVLRNIIHAATLQKEVLGPWRVVNLPGITVSVGEMVEALRQVAGKEVADLVHFEYDAKIAGMVSTFPLQFDNRRALKLGFVVNKDFVEIINSYIRNEKK